LHHIQRSTTYALDLSHVAGDSSDSSSCFAINFIEAAQQSSTPGNGQPFEPLVNRVRESLKLSETQVGEFRKLLVKHSQKLMELRNRAQTNPYAPGLQPEVEKEQKAIREELSAILDEDQKTRIGEIDLRPLVPTGPQFVAINILPRMRLEPVTIKLANAERLIPAPTMSPKGRAARLTDDQRILQVLNRLTFGPRPGDIARVQRNRHRAFHKRAAAAGDNR
jgi:hypothetical protein